MCGFAGFLSYAPQRYSVAERKSILLAMGEAIAHRGPDDEQLYDDGVLSLVFRRLAIVAPAQGRQPLLSADQQQLLVANAEIYNYQELRQALAPRYAFGTASDCEVLLHGWAAWGAEVLPRCRGMFAFAHWDQPQQRLSLGRDRLGIKPLYVCPLPHGVLFASELKALLQHPDCPTTVNFYPESNNLAGLSRTPSFIDGIYHLPAGSWQTFTPQHPNTTPQRWLNLADCFGQAPYGESEDKAEDYIAAYHALLSDSVREHQAAQGCSALFLSGGLDSSLLAGLAKQHEPELPCFTIVERTTYLGGDVASAQALCTKLKLPWHPVLFDYRHFATATEFNLGRLETAVWQMDSPRFSLDWFFKDVLSATVSELYPQNKVLLLGQGADEFAGGYSRAIESPWVTWQDYIAQGVEPWVAANLNSSERTGVAYYDAMLLFMRQLQYHNLWHEDRSSMWHGMEARVPYLDHRLLELLAAIPANLHPTLFTDKAIIRAVARRVLPDFVFTQPKIGLYVTKDIRSIELLLYGLAVAVLPEFLSKYAHRITDVAWQTWFVPVAKQLLAGDLTALPKVSDVIQSMCEVIFLAQCATRQVVVGNALFEPALPVLHPTDISALATMFLATPTLVGN